VVSKEFAMSEATSVAYFTVVKLSCTAPNNANLEEYYADANCSEEVNRVSISEVSPGGEAAVKKCEEKCRVEYATKQRERDEWCLPGCARFKESYLTGIVSGREGIVGGQPYRATIGGLRNPRNLVEGLEFGITTYAPPAFDLF